jgi:inositol-phosphate phosphatase / L-galactose 1-phosphate phosphatase / histidinol-phosphatase
MSSVADTIDFACELADSAGEIARRYFRTPVDVTLKADASPVSIADKTIEETLLTRIGAVFPAHGILGEETGSHHISRDYTWVIDPIDGTRAFLAGRPTFTTLIALCFQGTPILGIIDQPITGERYIGAAGRPSTLHQRPLYTRTRHTLAEASFATTSPTYFGADTRSGFEQLQQACGDVIYGGDAYNYAQLSAGFIDIVAEAGLKPYDVMALRPIIEGAGGMITTWQGAAITINDYHTVIAAGNRELHQQACALLA